MSKELLSTLITFLVGGGLVTLIGQIVRGWSSLRTGARASVREIVKDLADARDEAEDRLRTEQIDKEYFRGICGHYRFQLRDAGLEPDPADLVPPSSKHHRGRRRPGGPRAEEMK